MDVQIDDLVVELQAASAGARELVEVFPETLLSARPGEGRWSALECLAHLVVTSEAYVPLVSGALKANTPVGGERRFRMDAAGWLIARSLEPPARIRTRTVEEFQPRPFGSASALLARFLELQEGTEGVLRAAARYDLNVIKVISPFNRRIRYNLFSCFRILLAHQRRHLWQARRAVQRSGVS
jgi:hypothetical protein